MEKAKLTRKEALELLKRYPIPKVCFQHCLEVESAALKIAEDLERNGVEVDEKFLSTAALLHDIGRYKISVEKGVPPERGGLHAPEGQILLEKLGYPQLARIAGGHFLVRVTKEEAAKLGWPVEVELPNTIEAKIVCIADKMREGKPVGEEVLDLFAREDLEIRYWSKIPGFKRKLLKRTLAIAEELKLLGWTCVV